jgi:hypothetical protein
MASARAPCYSIPPKGRFCLIQRCSMNPTRLGGNRPSVTVGSVANKQQIAPRGKNSDVATLFRVAKQSINFKTSCSC